MDRLQIIQRQEVSSRCLKGKIAKGSMLVFNLACLGWLLYVVRVATDAPYASASKLDQAFEFLLILGLWVVGNLFLWIWVEATRRSKVVEEWPRNPRPR